MALPVAPPDPITPPELRAFCHDTEDTAADHETRIGSGESGLAAHLADTSDAHDASAISFVPVGTIAATTVQAAVAEVASEAAAALAAEAAAAANASNLTSGTVDDARIPSGIARDSEVTSAISTHAGASDPHGDRAFATSAVATALTTAETYADGKVAQSITDGVTTSAPSQDQVHDALALKADLASPGAVLAKMSYNPGSDADMIATSGTYVDADATNAKVTFIAPPSGDVVVTVGCTIQFDGGSGLGLNLREGSSDLAGTSRRVGFSVGAGMQMRTMFDTVITGLTPGASHTYKLGMARFTGSGNTSVEVGPDWGPLTMVVEAA